MYITYYMKDGTKVSRRFYIVTERAKDILLRLYKNEERIHTVVNQLYKDTPQKVDVSYTRDDAVQISIELSEQEFIELLNCYKRDLKYADESYLEEDKMDYIYFEWKNPY